MTNNQINLARHNEDKRHNLEMEKQGWFTASTDQLYKDRTGRANLEQAAAASSNAYTNSRNADTNWYNAWTGVEQKEKDRSQRDYQFAQEQQQKDEDQEISRQDLQRKYMESLGNLYNARTANDIAQQNANTAKKDAATRRSSMWFSAANSISKSFLEGTMNIGGLLMRNPTALS